MTLNCDLSYVVSDMQVTLNCDLFYVVGEFQVSMSFDKARGKPGDDVKMSLKASPSSLCAFGAVDKSVYLKGGNNQLSQKTLTNMISHYSLSEYTGYVYFSWYTSVFLRHDNYVLLKLRCFFEPKT